MSPSHLKRRFARRSEGGGRGEGTANAFIKAVQADAAYMAEKAWKYTECVKRKTKRDKSASSFRDSFRDPERPQAVPKRP